MKVKKEIFVHLFIWIFYVGNSVLTYDQYYINLVGMGNIAVKQASIYLSYIILFYINYFLLIPRYLSLKKYVHYSFAGIILIGFTLFLMILNSFFLDWYFETKNGFFINDRLKSIGYIILQSFFYMVISVGAKFTSDWFKNQKLREDLQKEKIISELALLKYQISPHFLFNTLNNIYSLTMRNSPKSFIAIHQLSEIMRYILNVAQMQFVPIQKEIEYLKSYIELQKLRLKKPEIVKLNLPTKTFDIQITPIILIPIVENAFKHSDLESEDAIIKISLEIDDNKIIFITENKIEKSNLEPSGIGLKNLKRRLEIIYNHNFTLKNYEKDSFYFVELIISPK